MIHRPSAGFALALLAVAATSSAGSPAPLPEIEMVVDLNTVRSGGTESHFPTTWARLGGALYAPFDDGVHGTELWAIDGTPGGTRLVADLCPGVCSSYPLSLTAEGARLFFTADDQAHGRELWVSDGTAAGTTRIDIVPGPGTAFPSDLYAFGGRLLFSAFLPGLGSEPWTSDGTLAGTALLADLVPGEAGTSPTFLGETGGKLLFAATDPVHGRELWATDGSVGGTTLLVDTLPGPDDGLRLSVSFPGFRQWALSGDLLFFVVGGSDQLWASDGTAAGTGPLLAGPPGSRTISTLEPLGSGRIVFVHDDPLHGREVWVSDGTPSGTGLLVELLPGPADPAVWLTASWDGKAFFYAEDGVHGFEPWATDGTVTGTVLLADARPGGDGQDGPHSPPIPVPFGDRLLFFAEDGVHGLEPWTTDGTPGGTSLLADLNAGPDGSSGGEVLLTFPADFGRRAIFRAFDPRHGLEPWVTDGTADGTQRLEVNRQTSSFDIVDSLRGYRPLGALGERVLFQAGTEADFEPWVSDGTANGTRRLVDLVPGVESSSPMGFVAIDRDQALFWANGLGLGGEIWRTDGTPAGTGVFLSVPAFALECAQAFEGDLVFSVLDALLRTDGTLPGTSELLPGSEFGSLLLCAPWGARVAFAASGDRIGTTDGTPEGTVALAVPATVDTGTLTPSGDRLYFVATDEATGAELWASDGTWPGTGRVVDLAPGPGAGVDPDYAIPQYPRSALAALPGGRVVFPGDEGAAGQEPWVSDGTAPGTFRLADVAPGASSSRPGWLTACGGLVYFTADDGASGRELWATDGSLAGTRRVTDVHPGAGSGRPEYLSCFGSQLGFSADDGLHGREPWITDGTVEGTRLAGDLAPGPTPSSPLDFTYAEGFVYFAATDGVHGFELWRWRPAPLELFRDGFESGDLEGWSGAVP